MFVIHIINRLLSLILAAKLIHHEVAKIVKCFIGGGGG